MSFPFVILISLIVATPVLAYLGASGAQSILAAAVAAIIAATATVARQADASHVVSATRGVLWLLLLPVLLIAVQLLPAPLAWSHPIWTIVAEATNGTSYGHITVDIGRSVSALLVSLTLVGASASSIAIARDRRRAELVLIIAGAVAALVSLIVIAEGILPVQSNAMFSHIATLHFAGLGVILNTAVILLAFERRETRKREAGRYLPIELGAIVGIIISSVGLYKAATPSQAVAVCIGLAVLLLLMIIRRLNLSAGTVVALCTATLIGIGILATWLFGVNPSASGLLRFIPAPDVEFHAILQRVLSDGRWLGSGAGTLDVLARIYQTGEPSAPLAAPTTMIQLSVETGWIGLCVFALVVLGLCLRLFRGALERGRDWFFPAVATACLVGGLFGSFVAPGLFEPSIAMLMTIVISTGLSQAFSQSGRA